MASSPSFVRAAYYLKNREILKLCAEGPLHLFAHQLHCYRLYSCLECIELGCSFVALVHTSAPRGFEVRG